MAPQSDKILFRGNQISATVEWHLQLLEPIKIDRKTALCQKYTWYPKYINWFNSLYSLDRIFVVPNSFRVPRNCLAVYAVILWSIFTVRCVVKYCEQNSLPTPICHTRLSHFFSIRIQWSIQATGCQTKTAAAAAMLTMSYFGWNMPIDRPPYELLISGCLRMRDSIF